MIKKWKICIYLQKKWTRHAFMQTHNYPKPIYNSYLLFLGLYLMWQTILPINNILYLLKMANLKLYRITGIRINELLLYLTKKIFQGNSQANKCLSEYTYTIPTSAVTVQLEVTNCKTNMK